MPGLVLYMIKELTLHSDITCFVKLHTSVFRVKLKVRQQKLKRTNVQWKLLGWLLVVPWLLSCVCAWSGHAPSAPTVRNEHLIQKLPPLSDKSSRVSAASTAGGTFTHLLYPSVSFLQSFFLQDTNPILNHVTRDRHWLKLNKNKLKILLGGGGSLITDASMFLTS